MMIETILVMLTPSFWAMIAIVVQIVILAESVAQPFVVQFVTNDSLDYDIHYCNDCSAMKMNLNSLSYD